MEDGIQVGVGKIQLHVGEDYQKGETVTVRSISGKELDVVLEEQESALVWRIRRQGTVKPNRECPKQAVQVRLEATPVRVETVLPRSEWPVTHVGGFRFKKNQPRGWLLALRGGIHIEQKVGDTVRLKASGGGFQWYRLTRRAGPYTWYFQNMSPSDLAAEIELDASNQRGSI